ncbi:permease [Listeria cornellensis FSL F6-0969]|uniref:Permease n=2 Tax=Listeria cornellensis TaxID=1494961 RepID=W7BQQ7_9LIST|nr:permease [Listeria cornellensis FSL F6-0969]
MLHGALQKCVDAKIGVIFMWQKGLWYKEWQGIKWVVPFVFLVFLLAFFVGLVNETDAWNKSQAHYKSEDFQVEQELDPDFAMTKQEIRDDLTVRYLAYETKLSDKVDQYTYFFFSFTVSVPFTLTLVLSVILGMCSVILERYTRGNHFTAVMPYSKKAILGVKVLLGFVVITVSYFVSLGLGVWYFTSQVPAEFVDFQQQKLIMDMLGSWLAYLLLFLLPIVVGYVIGSPLGGILATAGLVLLPGTILAFVVHMEHFMNKGVSGDLAYWSDYCRILEPLGFIRPAYGPLILQLGLLVGALVFAGVVAERESLETNGRLFVFQKMRAWGIGISAILIGMFVANMIQDFVKLSGPAGFAGFLVIFGVSVVASVVVGIRFVYGKRL